MDRGSAMNKGGINECVEYSKNRASVVINLQTINECYKVAIHSFVYLPI